MSTYAPEHIIQHIDAIWDSNYVFRANPDGEIVTGGGGASDGMNLVCTVADIRSAYGRLDKEQRQVIWGRFYFEWPLAQIQEVFGMEAVEDAGAAVDEALTTMTDYLNGAAR